MAIPAKNVLGNPNVTEGNYQIAIEQLRESVVGSGKAYDAANTYSQYDTCVYSGLTYYSKINSNTGNTPTVGLNWGLASDLLAVVTTSESQTISGLKTFSDGFVSTSATQTIGYATGSGGTVTQLTSKSTAVTLSKPTGIIITHNSTIIAGQTVQFNVYNSLVIDKTTNIIVTIYNGVDSKNYDISASNNGDLNFVINITNKSATNLSEVIQIKYELIKGAMA